LTFEEPDAARFPALGLARRALEAGGAAPTVLNAANEVAVEAFLGGRLRFTAIPMLIERTMNAHEPAPVTTLKAVRDVDAWARGYSHELAGRLEWEV
jgi:1-deoxy-D-xylulose-5-phosphate reductoisomerase